MKKIVSIVLAVSMLAVCLTGCTKNTRKQLKPVVLNEVAHSIFYAPQYAAIELGYFEEEGLDLKLVNGAGADKVMTALISGDADIGFMGSEASIYVYQQGSDDYAVNFAQLTQRAGNFLVGREADDDFTWSDLKGKKVLGGRAGGRPDYNVPFDPIVPFSNYTTGGSNYLQEDAILFPAFPSAHLLYSKQRNIINTIQEKRQTGERKGEQWQRITY